MWGTLDEPQSVIEALHGALSPQEQQQANRFATQQLSHRYIVAHAYLRYLLAERLRCQVSDLIFAHNEFGKPYLPQDPIHFNMSHSNNMVLFGFSHASHVGVDIEYMKRQGLDVLGIGARYFSANEYKKLQTLQGEQQIIAFYRIWTGKEALLKGLGLGIAHHLAQCEVSLLPTEAAEVLQLPQQESTTRPWQLHSFQPCGNYLVTAAFCA